MLLLQKILLRLQKQAAAVAAVAVAAVVVVALPRQTHETEVKWECKIYLIKIYPSKRLHFLCFVVTFPSFVHDLKKFQSIVLFFVSFLFKLEN